MRGAGPSGAGAVFGRAQRGMLLAGFALLVAGRLQRAWAEGRFQDEEASVFLAFAWHRPALEALFRPFAGYWNAAASAATLLVAGLVKSGAVGLEQAPYLTMAMAMAAQLLPAVLILTGEARWLSCRLAVVACLLVVATAPATEEVFLNVLHIQFHLTLCAALILAMDMPRSRIAQGVSGVLLFAAPLCGPGAVVLLPLVALRAWTDRDRARLVQLAALAAGAAIQMLVFYGASPIRGHAVGPGTIAAAMLVRLVALPMLGFAMARGIGAMIYLSQAGGGTGWWWAVAAAAALFGALLVQAARQRDGAFWLVLSALAIAVATLGFGMIDLDRYAPFDIAAERYDFLPTVLLGLAMVALAMRGPGRGQAVAASLCAVMLVQGALGYRHPLRALAQGPSWRAEVAAWRRDHAHPLAVWPAPWTADLSDGTGSCAAATGPAPRYCERGWLAGLTRAPRTPQPPR